ncbi:MAG: PQQ-dependent sugar dehydrogenase, partial [Bacteroidetes bacterium]|nr:PQQ-dependent sugar dehydrogenase [Bacteroidota bacterium]
NLLVGSLKATELYRMVKEGDQIVYRETILSNLARIRDVEVGVDGYIYLLLENRGGSEIVRLVPQ